MPADGKNISDVRERLALGCGDAVTRHIDANTALYAVIGNPINHSLSPVMHNAAFLETNVNGIYVAFNVTDIVTATAGLRSLGIAGISITIPHKTDIVKCLDQIDPTAEAIGAVNTVVNKNGKLIGYNTDGLGALHALSKKVSLTEKQVVLLGEGGTARAIGFTVAEAGALVTIVNRTVHKGESLARDLNVEFIPLQAFNGESCDVLINATPVGMAPHDHFAPIDEKMIHPHMVVMDVIYNPLITRLLQIANQAGCQTVSGVEMFVHQGIAQFELWTKRKAPAGVMRSAVLAALNKRMKA